MGRFGRSHDLRQLDEALRAIDVHPRLVTEAVKLTTVRILKDELGNDDPPAEAYDKAAALLGYCLIGPESFAGANSEAEALAVEGRIEAALDAGDSLDAQLVLLMLHAKAIQPSVVERFGLEAEG
jgi:hypothetical protein